MTGRVIAGRYILEQPIGRGAMGVVWRAHDQLLDREVAVKEVVLSVAIGEDERKNAYQRTLREARTAARLSHRGVVTVFDVAEEDGRPWIVMELVPSRSLDQVLASEGRMTPLRAGRMGQQVLAALAAAHAAGVLHRDVKPSNVLIATDSSGGGWDERAVLTDFGIAQFEGDPRLTQTGMVMGPPGFTAPERIRGSDATPASDLWSLGATLYAAVEGRGPYEDRGGPITTMSAIINEDAPVAPSAGRLAPLIAALLRREPFARPTAAAAARRFSEVLPLLSAAPPHPATVRSPYVPAPAALVVSAAKAPDEDAAPASADAPAAVDALDAVAGGAGKVPAPADDDDVAPAPDQDVALAGVGAAVAAESRVPDEAVPAESGAPAASASATLLDAVSEDLVASGGGVARFDSGADSPRPYAGSVAPAPLPDDPPAQAGEPASRAAERAAGPDALTASAPTEPSVPVAPPVPEQPKPTFTASKQAEQAGPSFSPSRPAPPLPSKPAPSFSASRLTWRTDPPTTPAPAYESPEYGGSDAYHAGSNAQYAGPSQPYPHPDLARQHAPGAGGRSQRRSRRGRLIMLIIAALVAAAAIGGGTAYALRNSNGSGSGTADNTGNSTNANLPKTVQGLDAPSAVLPADWTQHTVQSSQIGTTAGFTIDLPPGWIEQHSGRATYFNGPYGMVMEIDLTQHTYPNMVTEAKYIEKQSLAQGAFPHYKRFEIIAVPVRDTSGAFWQFTWVPPGPSVRYRTDDILFIKHTAAGPQSYAIEFWSPDSIWNAKTVPTVRKILRTFQTVPS
jgi:eukaryotic-like serine/threonine-protein kinase